MTVVRVLALVPYPIEGPSSRYRVYQFVEPLARVGVHVAVHAFMDSRTYLRRMGGRSKLTVPILAGLARGFAHRLKDLVMAGGYDCLVIHRQPAPALHRFWNWLFTSTGIPVVFDFDDAVFTEYDVGQLLRRSLVVVAGNDYLATYAREQSRGLVHVIPTVVDTDRYHPTGQTRPGETAAGWIGTESSYRRYLAPFLHDLVALCRSRGAEFRVIGPAPIRDEVQRSSAVFVPWSLDTEVAEMARFDVGVMPLVDDEYVRGKCAFKLVEYGAMGIPGVGTDIGANREVIVDGVTGLLAVDRADLLRSVDLLLGDGTLRQRMSAAARERIVEHFSLAAQVPVWAQLIRQAAGEGTRRKERRVRH